MLKRIIGKKKILMLVLGIIIGILISIVGVYAATLIDSKNVTYDNNKSNLTSTNVQEALDELHKRLVPKQEGLLSNYLISLFHNSNIKIVHIGGNNTKPTVMLNNIESLMLDNNGIYRYYGANPNNYIKFNNELWRIISISNVHSKENGNSEMRIKIIRDIPGLHSQYSTYVDSYATSIVKTYLNDTYYPTLTQTAKDMIDDSLFYLGAATTRDYLYPNDYYNFERGNVYYRTNVVTWTGKVGLMYASDYAYAPDLSQCTNVISDGTFYESNLGNDYRAEKCKNTNWLYNKEVLDASPEPLSLKWEWIINVNSGSVLYFGLADNVVFASAGANNDSSIRPVVYLKPNIKIISGTGKENDPYIIE